MVIGIDFDGTCTTHNFPFIGKDIGAVPVLKKLVEKGHQLVLFTMRSDKENIDSTSPTGVKGNKYLTHAVNWFKEHDIPLWGIQSNPTQHQWTDSPKAYCQLYIDDAALGIPLLYDRNKSDKLFVNWVEVEKMLIARKIL